MSTRNVPKRGSMAYYPRVRAKSMIPKFKSLIVPKEEGVKILNYYGYKVGMAHVMATNKHKGSPFANQKVALPATIIEIPGLTVLGARFYAKSGVSKRAIKDFVFTSKGNKFLEKRITGIARAKEKGDLLKKALELFEEKKDKLVEIALIAYTHPEKTTIGKKAPEVVELHLSGKPEEQLEFFKSKLGQDVSGEDFVSENTFVDLKGVTVGKGFQGVIKRFGVKRRHHKSEKGVRRVGSIGPWTPGTVMSTVPRPGQMGCHNRVQLSQKVLKFIDAKEANPKGGWEGYGVVKSKAVVVAGSVPGHVKRLIAFRFAQRKPKDIKTDISEINDIIF